MAGKIQVVVGGQFGSEGKGHACAELARREGEMLAIRTGGPNAGHTVYDDRNVQYKLRQLPVAQVVNPRAAVAIAAGALIQLDLAVRELKETRYGGVFVDNATTVLEAAHVTIEQGDAKLAWGSTQKGIGAARMDRLHRTARTFSEYASLASTPGKLTGVSVVGLAREYLGDGATVQIEAAQGYGLGLHTEYYPKTTSANCRAIDALADVGLSPWEFPDVALEVWVVIRPYPIRVAGDSGPLKMETTWQALGLPEERTTVTNKVRRVGAWDPNLVFQAVKANGTKDVKLWINMADHVFPFLTGRTTLKHLDREQRRRVQVWTARVGDQVGAPVHALGTGPATAIFVGED